MLALLEKLFPQTTARQLHYLILDYWGMLPLGIGFLAFSIWFFTSFSIEQRHFSGFVIGKVIHIYESSSETSGFRLYAQAELPQGARVFVKTRSYGLAAGTLETLCLRRTTSASGNNRYSWVSMHNCK